MSRFCSKVVIDIETMQVESGEWCEYDGPVALMKGATSDQKSLANDALKFYQTMQSNYSTVFADATNILGSLQASLNPVIKKGMNQYGFSNPEDAALRSMATNETAIQSRNTMQAAGERMAATGRSIGGGAGIGGEEALPSGTFDKIRGQIATKFGEDEANKQLGITEAGYAQGRQNFINATEIMSSAPGKLFQPAIGMSEVATKAGESAQDAANTVAKADREASPWSTIGGLVGGAAGAFLGPIGSSIGSKVGSFLGGAASGSNG